jgi:hypothetical protein
MSSHTEDLDFWGEPADCDASELGMIARDSHQVQRSHHTVCLLLQRHTTPLSEFDISRPCYCAEQRCS